jgi:iron complex transport system permease protein
MAALAVLLAAAVVVSLGMGAVQVPPGEVIKALLGQETAKASHAAIVNNLRLPRIALAMLIGGGLAAAGAAFQGLFQNALAEPYIIGASSGASLGVAIAFAGGWAVGSVNTAAFIGALAAVAIAYTIAEIGGSGSVMALLLAGVALSAMFSAGVSLLMVMRGKELHEVYYWLMGSLNMSSSSDLQMAALMMPAGIAGLLLLSRPLDALSLGDESAQTLGLNLRQTRLMVIAVGSLLTASAVSASGVIGFVGLIAPHIARRVVGADHARVLPASVLLGALLMLVADSLARTILAPLELPVGILTALIGGPFFIYLLVRGET